jgi:pimeloyl-ACP methyl ester carboxylesterase
LLIDLAFRGDFSLLASRLASREESWIPKGIYLSLVCSEQMQFDQGALPAAAAGTFLGGLRVGRDVSACREWVRGWLPPSFFTPVASAVPALVMNGALDHVTPPRYGERVARTLSSSRHLSLPGRGHNDTDACVCGMIEAFILAGKLEGLDASCLAQSEQLSFALRREELLD